MHNLSLIAFFALIAATVAAPAKRADCEKTNDGICGDNTRDCCDSTQGFPIYYEVGGTCHHPFGKGINWDKFAACCSSKGTTATCK
ncbi:hypothetical protein BC941DRAFT_436768 [Chlamydoabsidia padenii]|nr:hypothetical protein BC941DRAFT_436768 [Chlamydoabsidia padenii]